MFESLKKKFSRTSDKLEEELKEEAEQKNNIKEEKEGKKKSFFSFGRKNKKKEEETPDKKDSDKPKSIDSDIADSIEKEVKSEELKQKNELSQESDKDESLKEETENKKSRFWSRSKKDFTKEEENLEEQDNNDSSEDADENKKSRFWSRSKKDTPEEEKEEDKPEEDDSSEEEKKSHFWSRSKKDSTKEEEYLEEQDDDSFDEDENKKSHFWNRSKKEDSTEDRDDDESSGGIFSFIREKTISEKNVEDILWDLEMGLLEGDVAMEVASKVVDSVKNDLVGKKIKRSNDITEYTFNALKDAVTEIIDIDGKSMTEMIEDKVAKGEPLVVMFVGINGTGKTTTIGKLAHYYLNKGYTPVIAASDTFRAGAIEQVTHHADNVGVKIIKHQKGSDPAAVAFDAIEHAKSQNKELVLIDTAGRMQNNVNLMDEMKKIKRVSNPDLVIFVGDALTGNDATEQARKFNDTIDIDGVILTKADADSKGGASLSIGYVIQKPILFLGLGQGYDDIMEYDADWMIDQLFSQQDDEGEISEVE